MKPAGLISIFLLASLGASSCSKSELDSDLFPYKMIGLNSMVTNNDTEQEFIAGFTAANYKARKAGLSGCAAQAATAAAARHLKDWSYMCCTVTEKSQCVTTVR